MQAEVTISVDNTEHWRRFFADETAAIDRCLQAMTVPYIEWVKRALMEGFTTGEYVTGAAAASVYATAPVPDADGNVSLGVTSDLDYVWFWEFGFHHAGSGRWYRSPTFAPALEAARPEMEDAWAAQMAAELSY